MFLLKFLFHFPFVSFSLSLSSLYSLSQSSLFSLSPIPSFSSDQFFVLIKTSSFITFCFTNGTFFFLHSVSHHDIFFLIMLSIRFWLLSSNLSYPEDLKKQWLHCRVGSSSLRPSSSNYLFTSFSIPSLLPFSILSLLPFLISPSLSTIPSCSSDQFSVLVR